MKKVISILSIACLIGFSNSIIAQTMPKMPSTTVKVPTTTDGSTKQLQTLFETPDAQKKVKEEMMKNPELQDKTIDYLKNNPETV